MISTIITREIIISIVAGLLHDVVEDTLSTIENVSENFGKDVAHIVAGVTKISKLEFATEEQAEAENLRRMILAMVDDIRVILVKLTVFPYPLPALQVPEEIIVTNSFGEVKKRCCEDHRDQ